MTDGSGTNLAAKFWGPGEPTNPTAKNRAAMMQRACECGCDERDGGKIVGYLSTSNAKGQGITIYAPDEATYQAMRGVWGGQK